MKKFITVLVLLFAGFSALAQTVEELFIEFNKHRTDSNRVEIRKRIAYQILDVDSLNTYAILFLHKVYGINGQADSIRMLYDNLTQKYPASPKPYLLRVTYPEYEKLSYIDQINFLKEAKKVDRNNAAATYLLGKLYYKLFNMEFNNRNRGGEHLNEYALTSIDYFKQFHELQPLNEQIVYFPLVQLANYLGNQQMIRSVNRYTGYTSYFPPSLLVKLPKGWQTDYSVDIFETDYRMRGKGLDEVISHTASCAEYLKAMNEPVLNDSIPGKVYRFLWLRSFDDPISIRIEHVNDSITLYWKITDGSGNSKPGNLIADSHKKLSAGDWKIFIDIIDSINYWKLSSEYSIGTDGAYWILEGKEPGRYQVIDDWDGNLIEKACLKLLEFTELKDIDVY